MSGMIDIKMPARPLSICCWAAEISQKGRQLPAIAIARLKAQNLALIGKR